VGAGEEGGRRIDGGDAHLTVRQGPRLVENYAVNLAGLRGGGEREERRIALAGLRGEEGSQIWGHDGREIGVFSGFFEPLQTDKQSRPP
jgi:hypothetical protein